VSTKGDKSIHSNQESGQERKILKRAEGSGRRGGTVLRLQSQVNLRGRKSFGNSPQPGKGTYWKEVGTRNDGDCTPPRQFAAERKIEAAARGLAPYEKRLMLYAGGGAKKKAGCVSRKAIRGGDRMGENSSTESPER